LKWRVVSGNSVIVMNDRICHRRQAVPHTYINFIFFSNLKRTTKYNSDDICELLINYKVNLVLEMNFSEQYCNALVLQNHPKVIPVQ